MQNIWKQVPIETSQLNASDLEYIDGIEELSNYEILHSNSNTTKRKRAKQLKKGRKIKVNAVPKDKSSSKVLEKKAKIDMSAWDQFKIPSSVLSAMEELRFTQPTEIQSLSMPSILNGKDVLGAAETGSGKTLAFGLPIIKNIIAIKESKRERNLEDKQLYCLILTPTRELAIQIKKHLQAVSKYTDVMISVVVGGMAPEKQRRVLKKCPDIVVATPGRLWEMIEEGEEHINKAPNVRYLVIDEADRMVEKGHFAELTQILDLINGVNENRKLHRYVFSATLSLEVPHLKNKKKKQKLNSIIKLIGLKDPAIVDITNKKAVAGTLIESQLVCRNEEKDSYLYYFLCMYPGRTLVFCNSIDCVRRVRSVLEYLNCNPLPLHASMHQRQRLKNLEKFEKSDSAILLATDVAARGLDIKEIQHVIHYQVPRAAETYVHRSGRTARAKNEGLSLMLIEPQEAVFYKRICKALDKDHSLPTFPIDDRVFKQIKEKVTLARTVEKLEHRLKKLTAQNRWFENAAKEMDVDIQEENLLLDLKTPETVKEFRKLKHLKKMLSKYTKFSSSPGVQTAVEALRKKHK